MENFPYRLYCGRFDSSSESELELDEDKGPGLSSPCLGDNGGKALVLDSPLPLCWGISPELRLNGLGSVATASSEDWFLTEVGRGKFGPIKRYQYQPMSSLRGSHVTDPGIYWESEGCYYLPWLLKYLAEAQTA